MRVNFMELADIDVTTQSVTSHMSMKETTQARSKTRKWGRGQDSKIKNFVITAASWSGPARFVKCRLYAPRGKFSKKVEKGFLKKTTFWNFAELGGMAPSLSFATGLQ